MRVLETLPIYFQTHDARINQFLNKNRLHHELSTLGNTVYSARPHTIALKGGKGRIRTWLFICAVVALYLFFAMQAWGLI